MPNRYLLSPCSVCDRFARVRLVDMFMREFVHLLWIIEGPKFMGAHAGNIFFYHPDGAFVPYRGALCLTAN